MQGTSAVPSGDRTRQREIVAAFLAASRGGQFDRLLALLDPDVVLRADAATVRSGAEPEVLGASAVATTFSGRARAARLGLVDGAPGLLWAPGGQPRVVFTFQILDGRIAGIGMISDPVTLGELDLEILAD